MSLILGIESSCDETAAALVTSDRRILAHALAGQESAHRPFGGVVPEIAARAHVEILPGLIEQVLAEAQLALEDVDAIAATAGPGLIGGVMVGLVILQPNFGTACILLLVAGVLFFVGGARLTHMAAAKGWTWCASSSQMLCCLT